MVEIGSVVLNVTDIGRAATFWRGALGYVPVVNTEGGRQF